MKAVITLTIFGAFVAGVATAAAITWCYFAVIDELANGQ